MSAIDHIARDAIPQPPVVAPERAARGDLRAQIARIEREVSAEE